jgi:hypothetical protein
MTRKLRQSQPIVSRLRQDHGPTSFTIMSLAIQYAHELGYRLEGETVAPCEVPNGLAQNMTFFGACITQKYFWFEDMYRWYVFFREHGIEPESIAEYASQQLASRDAWRLFVHSVYRPEQQNAKRARGGRRCLLPMLGLGDGVVVERVSAYLACDQLPIFWKICSRVVEQAPSFNWRRYYHHYVSEMEESDESDECDADWESSEE